MPFIIAEQPDCDRRHRPDLPFPGEVQGHGHPKSPCRKAMSSNSPRICKVRAMRNNLRIASQTHSMTSARSALWLFRRGFRGIGRLR